MPPPTVRAANAWPVAGALLTATFTPAGMSNPLNWLKASGAPLSVIGSVAVCVPLLGGFWMYSACDSELRVESVVGAALPGTAPLPLDIAIEGVQVCTAGMALPYDAGALAQAVAGDEVEYVVGLPGDGAETEVFFSDLGYDYVRINAEYTT